VAIHALRAFRHRNFRYYFCGQSLSMVGTWIQQIAMSWLVYRLTDSPFLLVVTAFSAQIPILVLGALGGVWSDRVDRHKLMVATQILAMVQGLALAALTYAGAIEVWHIIALATVLGVITAIDMPLRQTFVAQMVPAKEDLPAAIAFNGFMMNAGRMIGPAIAGALLIYFSEAFCFLINAISKIAALAAILALTVVPNVREANRKSVIGGLAQGLHYAWHVVPIRILLPVAALLGFMVTPYQTLLPVYAKEIIGGGPEMLGILMAAAGFGSLLAPIYHASRRDVRGLARIVLGGLLVTGVALMVFAYSRNLWLAMPMLALTGLGVILSAQAIVTIMQTIVDDAMRGRIMSLFTVAFMGISPLGSLAAGAMAHVVGAEATLFTGGVCCCLGAVVLLRQMPRLRANIRPIYVKLGIVQE
jgi:MFS family permease